MLKGIITLSQPQEESPAAHLQVEQIDSIVAAAGVEGARDILDAFWRSTMELLEGLASQIAEGDFGLAAQTAHAVKGSAANVGAQLLSTTAATIENACKSGDHALATGLLQQVAMEFETVRVCFEEHLSRS